MALIDSIRTHADAMADFASWTKDFDNVADPLRRAARIMAALAQVMATVIDTQAAGVQALSQRMALVNDALKQVNAAIWKHKGQPEGTDKRLVVAETREVLDRFRDLLQAEGVNLALLSDPGLIDDSNDPDDGLWEIIATPNEMESMKSTLQTSLDSLSSQSQSDQARVQTTLGRYNAVFELVSSLIKKAETQGDTVSTNLKT